MIKKEVLLSLYNNEKLSQHEIAGRLGVNYKKVIYWMEKYKIPRRSRSEATYLKRNPEGDPFKIKTGLSPEEKELLGLGLGLFWGEGNKKEKNSIRLGNTDPQLIKKFIEFLIVICGINTDKLRFGLQIFNDIDKTEAINFWRSHLSFDDSQLHKVIVSPPQGKGAYKKKSRYGVLQIYFCNKKLRDWLENEMKRYSQVVHLVQPEPS